MFVSIVAFIDFGLVLLIIMLLSLLRLQTVRKAHMRELRQLRNEIEVLVKLHQDFIQQVRDLKDYVLQDLEPKDWS